RQCLVVIGPRGVRIQPQVELVFPTELETGLGQRVVADLGTRMTFGQIGSMRGNLVGDDAGFDIVLVGQAQVFLRRDIAQHGTTVPADHGGADTRGDVVVTGSNIGDQRT